MVRLSSYDDSAWRPYLLVPYVRTSKWSEVATISPCPVCQDVTNQQIRWGRTIPVNDVALEPQDLKNLSEMISSNDEAPACTVSVYKPSTVSVCKHSTVSLYKNSYGVSASGGCPICFIHIYTLRYLSSTIHLDSANGYRINMPFCCIKCCLKPVDSI